MIFYYCLMITIAAECGIDGGTDDDGCPWGRLCSNTYDFIEKMPMNEKNECIKKKDCDVINNNGDGVAICYTLLEGYKTNID